MYGSYGSYSSMGAISITAPMDITSSNMLAHDRSCAFPSWPRRDSLSSSDSERPTSYLSDEDLFLPDTFEDDSHSISGASSTTASPPRMNADEFLDLQQLERQREAMQREAALRYSANEKERRRLQAARRQRAMGQSRSSSSKKTSKSKLASMTSVAESAVFED